MTEYDYSGNSATAMDFDIEVPSDKLDPGEYVVRLVNAKQKKSKAGDPMIQWDVAVAEGPDTGFQLSIWTVLTPQAIWKAKKVAKAFGLLTKGADGKSRITGDPDAKGRVAIGTVEDDEYNGEAVSRLQDVTPHPDGYDALVDDLAGLGQ